ncbi:MAG: c-type cytochrome [Deltaproteobacteria bacterium]|nr:c-type cytochrome [Deltaproteobacteria bacterium]
MKKRMLPLIMLAVLVWAGYAALMAYDKYFPYGRMRETPAVRPYEKPIPVMEAGTVPVADPEAAYQAMEARKLRSPLLPGDPNAIARGQVVYATFCRQCHGRDHDGNGTVGQSFSPLPADLRSSRVQESMDGVLFQHISCGAGSGSRQPALATTIQISDRWSVIAYIKSIGVRG